MLFSATLLYEAYRWTLALFGAKLILTVITAATFGTAIYVSLRVVQGYFGVNSALPLSPKLNKHLRDGLSGLAAVLNAIKV